MKTPLRTLTALAAALLAAALLAASPAAAASKLGGTLDARAFEKLVRGHQGTPVVVNFFATWCPPCRMEIPDLVEMHGKYGREIVFLGITVDDDSTVAQVNPLLEKTGISYDVYRAAPDLVAAFTIRSIPFNLAYGRDGKVAFAYMGVAPKSEYEDLLKQLLK